MVRLPLVAISLAAIGLSYVAADSETIIYVPFNDPQPISADILGVDAQGRTTWALHQGAKTGTWADQADNLVGTGTSRRNPFSTCTSWTCIAATLVEGADFASLTYAVADPSFGTVVFGGACSINGGDAVCVEAQSGDEGATTFTETENVVSFGVQIAATAAPGSNPGPSVTPAPSGSTTGGASGNPTPTGGAKSGSSVSSSAPASTQSSSSTRMSVSRICVLAGPLLAYHFR